ncbi:hypothetical protein M0534_08500 [Methylonatrum kenyense]|uniref:hypothetical protein n=1 Tax=Methylonatrum kenyense TaxID=455253 RepID=UPI0020BFE211|nr:hypothetical protein [Methylonatrum kenyense]MCK8516364.1 hypothetical protein [Methylonatrum kenyense]
MTQPRTIIPWLALACLLLPMAPAAQPISEPLGPDQLAELERHQSLALSDCNRAISLHVTGARLQDGLDGESPADGDRWLVLDLRFDNWMPADLLFGLNYPEPILIASLERQLYLLANGARINRATLPADSGMTDEFVLPHVGASASGQVAYRVPTDGLQALSLHYYHDEYAPLRVSLVDGEATASDALDSAENDLMRIGIHDVSLHEQWRGEAAPEGMQWVAVDLRGTSLWTIEADARALDVSADLDARAEVPKVMEYMEASGLLQLVVDQQHGYLRRNDLGTLPADPPWLPDATAGGLAVFPVPEQADQVELVAHFPQFRATDIPQRNREPIRFTLDLALESDRSTEGMASTEVLLEIADEPTPFQLHDLREAETFATHSAEPDTQLLLLTGSLRNESDTGGMMPISNRLTLVDADEQTIEPLAVYQPGPLALEEPFWLPAGGEARRFTAVYRIDAATETLTLDYTGVSHSEVVELPTPAR